MHTDVLDKRVLVIFLSSNLVATYFSLERTCNLHLCHTKVKLYTTCPFISPVSPFFATGSIVQLLLRETDSIVWIHCLSKLISITYYEPNNVLNAVRFYLLNTTASTICRLILLVYVYFSDASGRGSICQWHILSLSHLIESINVNLS